MCNTYNYLKHLKLVCISACYFFTIKTAYLSHINNLTNKQWRMLLHSPLFNRQSHALFWRIIITIQSKIMTKINYCRILKRFTLFDDNPDIDVQDKISTKVVEVFPPLFPLHHLQFSFSLRMVLLLGMP